MKPAGESDGAAAPVACGFGGRRAGAWRALHRVHRPAFGASRAIRDGDRMAIVRAA